MTGGAVEFWPGGYGKTLLKDIMKKLEPGFGEYHAPTPNAKYQHIGDTFISVAGGEGYTPASTDYIVKCIKESLHEPFGYMATGDVQIVRMPSFIEVRALTRGLIFKIQFRKESPYWFDWQEVNDHLREKYPGAYVD